MKRIFCIVVGFCVLWSGRLYSQQTTGTVAAPSNPGPESARIDSLQMEIKNLQSRLKTLEKERRKEKQKAEMDALLQAASELAQKEKKQGNKLTRVFRGGQRQLQALNPNISLTGDFFGSLTSSDQESIVRGGAFSDGRNTLYLREAEFHIIAPLDPYTRGKFFLGIPGHGEASLSDMIGEAYMEWLNLPANMNLKIGKFNAQFGLLNRWHDHGLPQVDRPKPLLHLFGMENFGSTGIAANFLLPGLWAHSNELDIEILTGGDGITFDSHPENVIAVSRLKNYFDLTRNTYLEIGLSGAHGHNCQASGKKTTLGNVDFTVKWSPAGRAHYRTIEFRNEFFYSHRETPDGTLKRNGFYSYLSNKMGARHWVGVRYAYSELPTALEKEHEWDISPYIDFWQSEFVFARLQYSYTHRSYDDNDHAVFLQTVWSMGPHKHESY